MSLQDCLSKKIPHLIHAGHSQEQAIAIAYSECGEKSSPVAALPEAQQLAWQTAFADAYAKMADVEQAIEAAWSSVGMTADKAIAALKGRCGDRPCPDDILVAAGGAVKALDETGRIGGYLVVFGDPDHRDLDGEYFTPRTDFKLDWFDRRPYLYHHGMDPTLKAQKIGIIDAYKVDDVGLWIEAQLDLSDRYNRAVNDLIKRGKIRGSIGSAKNLVDISPDGEIKVWPFLEGSGTPSPCFPPVYEHSTQVMPLKALHSVPDLEGLMAEADGEPGAVKSELDRPALDVKENPMSQELIAAILDALVAQLGAQITPEQRQALIDQIAASMGDQATQAVQNPEAVGQAIAAAAGKALVDMVAADRVRQAGLAAVKTLPVTINDRLPAGLRSPKPGNGQIAVATKYHDLSAEDMSFALSLTNAIRRATDRPPVVPDEAFMRELADKAGKAYADHQIHLTPTAVKAVAAIKSDELDYSTQASYGDEWVPELWSNQLWEKARLDNQIAPLFEMIDMPSNPYKLPLEAGDPTVYYVGESTDEDDLTVAASTNPIPDSKLGTGNTTLTAKKLALRVGFSGEVEEDSVIPFSARGRQQALRALEDALDHVVLNGDDSSSGNINLDGGTPTTQKYMAFDGLRHLPIITTTANAISAAGAAPSISLIRQARFSMAGAYSVNPKNLAIITHAEVFAKMLDMGYVLTLDKYGPQATVLTGELGKVDGMPVIVTAELALTATNGKISSTGGNNLYGSLAIVHRPSWIIGFRRRVKAVLEYLSGSDAYQLTATMRACLARNNADCSAVLCYLGV